MGIEQKTVFELSLGKTQEKLHLKMDSSQVRIHSELVSSGTWKTRQSAISEKSSFVLALLQTLFSHSPSHL